MSARAFAAIVFMLSALTRCHDMRGANRPNAVPLQTTICKIASSPHRFYNKRVRLRGCIITDGIEHTVLIDKACPYTGIGPLESTKLPAAQRLSPEAGKEICGTFTGFFRAATAIDKNVLEIDEAVDVTKSDAQITK